jgi:hypothetical protein
MLMTRLLIAVLILGGVMENIAEAAGKELPVEPQSTSELLSATHIFTVSIAGRQEAPWAAGPGGLQQRKLRLQLELLESLKGSLDVAPGGTFALEVPQKRVSELVEMDYMGLWSHADTTPGVRYLVISAGGSKSPAELMQEGPCQRLFDAKLAADVHAAVAAEPATDAPRLLQYAYERRTAVDELFGRYFWARLRPAFLREYPSLISPLLRLVQAAGEQVGFRRSVMDGLDDAVGLLDAPEDLVIPVARAYFQLLEQRETEPIQGELIEVHLFNTVFKDEGKPRMDSHLIFPDPADRQKYAALLKGSDLKRAAELRRWL